MRLELGCGSPARVGGLFDQWSARLRERLSGETRFSTLPGDWRKPSLRYGSELSLAQGVVEQSTAEQRQVLDAKRERLALVEDQAQRIWRKWDNRFQKRTGVTRPNHELKQKCDVLRDTQQQNRALQQKTPGVATES